jgi:hypothetical protein
MRYLPLLIITLSGIIPAGTPFGLSQDVDTVEMTHRVPFGSAAVNLEGTLLVADISSDIFREIRNGDLAHDYPKPPYSRCVFAAFAPSGRERYLLYHTSQGYEVHVYSDEGDLTRRIRLSETDFSAAAFQVDSRGRLLLLRKLTPDTSTEDLILRFDPEGNLTASFLPYTDTGLAPQRNTARMVVGESDEIAAFVPESGTVYWLDSAGDLIRAVSAFSLVTAIGLVDGELWISRSAVEPLPTSRSEVHAVRILDTVLQRVPRLGGVIEQRAPEGIKGITHIGSDGTLFSVTSAKLVVARP